LFARVAVVPGRLNLAAAHSVSGSSTGVELPLARLAASSLVQPDEQADGGMRQDSDSLHTCVLLMTHANPSEVSPSTASKPSRLATMRM
jgi:hypothetical protein